MFENGMLPIVLAGEAFRTLSDFVERNASVAITVDLRSYVISIGHDGSLRFEIPGARRTMLLEGLDDFDLVMALSERISTFEDRAIATCPCIYDPP